MPDVIAPASADRVDSLPGRVVRAGRRLLERMVSSQWMLVPVVVVLFVAVDQALDNYLPMFEDKPHANMLNSLYEGAIICMVLVAATLTWSRRFHRQILAQKTLLDNLHQSHALFQGALDSLTTHIALIDQHGIVVAVNETWRRFTSGNGYIGSGLVVGEDYLTAANAAAQLAMIDPVGAEAAVAIHDLLAGRRTHAEVEGPVRNGKSIQWFVTRMSAFHIDGEIYLAIVHEDATARHLAMQERVATETRLQQLLIGSPVVIYSSKASSPYHLTFISENAARQFGYAPETILASRDFWIEHVHPDDREQFMAYTSELADAGRVTHEYRFLCHDGRHRWIRDELTIVQDGHTGMRQVIGCCVDITERRAAEEALLSQQQLLHSVISDIPNTVFWKDRESRYLGCNDHFLRDSGLESTNSVVGKTDFDMPWSHEEAEFYRECDRKVMAGGEPMRNFEETQLRPDGTTATLLTSKVPLKDMWGEVVGILGMYVDITERKKAEEAAREVRTLHEAVEAMEQVLGVIGHELRTPLAGLRAMTEMLMTPDSDMSMLPTFLHAMNNEVIRMADMVNNMLEAARLNSANHRWNWGMVQLEDVCYEAAAELMPLLDTDMVSLEVNVQPADLIMRGDGDAIRRLVLNLITNAHKHTARGRIAITVTPAPGSAPGSLAPGSESGEGSGDGADGNTSGGGVVIQVSDTGDGIAPEIRDKLGEAFALNSGSVGSSYVRGAGLGLAICKGIAAAHGGSISVQSTPGEGSTFTVRLRSDLPEPCAGEHALAIVQEDLL